MKTIVPRTIWTHNRQLLLPLDFAYANFIRQALLNELKAYGLDPKVESFEHLAWKRGTANFEILKPAHRKLHTISLAGAPSTNTGGIEGEVLYLG
jgi:hypothetical protein